MLQLKQDHKMHMSYLAKIVGKNENAGENQGLIIIALENHLRSLACANIHVAGILGSKSIYGEKGFEVGNNKE